MFIKNESILREMFQQGDITSNEVQMTIWCHNTLTFLREGESILNECTLTVVMQDLVSIYELSSLLQVE